MKALGKKALLRMFAFRLSVKQCKRKLKYVILKREELQTYWFTVTKFICCTSHTWRLNNDIIDDSYKNNIKRLGYAFLVLTFFSSFWLPGYWHLVSKKIYIKAIHSTKSFNLWKLCVSVILLYLVLQNYIKAHYWLILSYLHCTVCYINYNTVLISGA